MFILILNMLLSGVLKTFGTGFRLFGHSVDLY